jgi:hypothetical protein
MSQDTMTTSVRDLTAKLSSIADDFATRLEGTELTDAERAPESVAMARSLLKQRQLRHRFLPTEIFHEPAWDMLLALFVAEHDGRTMNVKTLVSSAEAPVTTSQRWIDHLARIGLIDRVTDFVDRRRIEVTLSDAGRQALERYLAAVMDYQRQ